VVLKSITIKGGNWVPGIDRNRYFIDSINTLRFWHRYLSIPEIRYFCQAWVGVNEDMCLFIIKASRYRVVFGEES
jgi:hypothetical protein